MGRSIRYYSNVAELKKQANNIKKYSEKYPEEELKKVIIRGGNLEKWIAWRERADKRAEARKSQAKDIIEKFDLIISKLEQLLKKDTT